MSQEVGDGDTAGGPTDRVDGKSGVPNSKVGGLLRGTCFELHSTNHQEKFELSAGSFQEAEIRTFQVTFPKARWSQLNQQTKQQQHQ